MEFPRSSGILLHPTSLPGPYGIGELGAEACRFTDFLSAAGQHIWQVLPLGPTGFGDSPYQLFSAFAGNPLLVSVEQLAREGWVDAADLNGAPAFAADAVEFESVIPWKRQILRRSYQGFQARAGTSDRQALDAFCAEHAGWLEDYALFMALKEAHAGASIWTEWEPAIARREPHALATWRERLIGRIAQHRFEQFQFFRQWNELRSCCARQGIRIMGDLPIYVAHDSADVWAHPDLFCLDPQGNPELVAGVPPDYFSATGQLWGNPIYRWDRMAESGYRWWIDRMRATLATVDMVRLDHFRGFEAYWQVPAGEPNAIHGRWVKGPGAELFRALRSALGELPIVAENLGVITPEVEAIRNEFGFPGMAVLQFAFGKDPQAPSFKPHNYPRPLVAYTGTHDNDTVMGWWKSSGAGDSTRTVEDVRKEKEFARVYLATGGHEMNWVFIRALMASVANTVIFPLQDVLGAGSDARMNTPAVAAGNWRWRYSAEDLTPEMAARLKLLAATYDR